MGHGTRAKDGPGMRLMRLWLWAVPLVMLAGSVLFASIAAADEQWGLFAVMVAMGLFALSLLAFHWWLLYRFGSAGR